MHAYEIQLHVTFVPDETSWRKKEYRIKEHWKRQMKNCFDFNVQIDLP
jgi:hypothetical protein